MDISEAKSRPIDMKVVDATDEALDAIVRLRKSIGSPEARIGFVRGLYFISCVDSVYSDEEKALVEGTACALGVGESALASIADDMKAHPESFAASFATAGNKKYRAQLFEEMAMLTYLKGYQLASEDAALAKVAEEMGIKAEKAEKVLYELYMESQGYETSKKPVVAKAAIGVGAVAVGAAVFALSAGAAAPAIGAAIGGLQGLHGIAAVNAGLAILGGGAVAMGGGGVAAGTAAIIAAGAVAGGGIAAVGLSVMENISAAHDKKRLQAVIKQQQKSDMTKQEITENLMQAIEFAKARLDQLEKLQASRRDIASIELQIANLQAQKAEVELGGEA